MIFDQIVLSGSSDIVLFDHKNPLSTPYVTRTIDGLDPTESNVSLVQTTQGTGLYLGSKPQLREITFTLELNPDYTMGQTPESLRRMLYRMRPLSRAQPLKLLFKEEWTNVAYTDVYIKRIETSVFANNNLLQLVLASPNPYLTDMAPVSLTIPSDHYQTPTFINMGEVKTGFLLNVVVNQSLTGFRLRLNNDDQTEFEVDAPFIAGDTIQVDSNIGSRGVWRIRGGVKTSVLNGLTVGSPWVELYPDENFSQLWVKPYTVPTSSAVTSMTYEYTQKYLGV